MAISTPNMDFARNLEEARRIIAQFRTETRLNRDAVDDGRKAVLECWELLRNVRERADWQFGANGLDQEKGPA